MLTGKSHHNLKSGQKMGAVPIFILMFLLFAAPGYAAVNETASYITFISYQIPADGTSVCTAIVTINDIEGLPIPGKLVTLATAREDSDTVNDRIGEIQMFGSVRGIK